jgi:hypothetical protein
VSQKCRSQSLLGYVVQNESEASPPLPSTVHCVGFMTEFTAFSHPISFNIGVNDDFAADQTVEHAHVHVIPRWKGDVPIRAAISTGSLMRKRATGTSNCRRPRSPIRPGSLTLRSVHRHVQLCADCRAGRSIGRGRRRLWQAVVPVHVCDSREVRRVSLTARHSIRNAER